ncbi:MAG TPA: recombinase XerD [Xanthobacteraceae bacterium]|nr:recombinase XerD [Xanthobacteraceae bacterium]
MLFRLVRPLKRPGSRNPQFVKRIPADVRPRAAGLKLAIPVGDSTQTRTVSGRAHFIKLSLRTNDPAEVKARLAVVDAYLENVWRGLRATAPVSLTHKQATALAGELYRGWAQGADSERALAVEHVPGIGWQRVIPEELPEEWDAVLARWEQLGASEDIDTLERTLGAIVDRLLLARGIKGVDEASRATLLKSFWQAARDAFETRKRNAEGDYSPDPKSERFPEWTSPQTSRPAAAKVSLKGLVEAWWLEAKATGRKPSTYESYRNTMTSFADFLEHDDATRVSRDDVVRFKDHRLASVHPRTGKPISAKTVKDSDLAGLKTVFGWAKVNGKLVSNPAEGITIKLGKPRKLRSKGFTDSEATAILKAALRVKQGQERPETFAAKRWVPWLCAYTGGRVGELAQLRKEDIRREGKHWVATITPEAGTVKNNEARDVVLHPHLVELGFIEFVKRAPKGHLFLRPASSGDVLGPLKGLKNRLREFVRAVVPDRNVAPNHGWRHRFKTVGVDAAIEHRVLDAIQGQQPRNVSESYGEVTIKAQAAAIAKLPRYLVR